MLVPYWLTLMIIGRMDWLLNEWTLAVRIRFDQSHAAAEIIPEAARSAVTAGRNVFAEWFIHGLPPCMVVVVASMR